MAGSEARCGEEPDAPVGDAAEEHESADEVLAERHRTALIETIEPQ